MDPLTMAFRLLKSVDGWLWVVAIVGLARSRLQRRRSSPGQPAVTALISLAATLLLYDLGVRRSPLTRFLFGLKPPGGPTRTDTHSAHQVR